MAKEVIKKNGGREPFDAQKLRGSIESAFADAGIQDESSAGVVDQVAQRALAFADGKETVTSAELKTEVLAALDTLAPEAAAAWRRYGK